MNRVWLRVKVNEDEQQAEVEHGGRGEEGGCVSGPGGGGGEGGETVNRGQRE